MMIILIVIGAPSVSSSPAAPEELSIAGLEKYEEISHKVLTVEAGNKRPESDQQSEVRCFSPDVPSLVRKFSIRKCFASLSLSS